MKLVFPVLIIALAVTVFSKPLLAQGIGEYGRVLGEAGRNNKGIGKTAPPTKGLPDSGKPNGGNMGAGGATGLPAVLTVSVTSAVIYSRSEDWSDKIAEVSLGERVTPLVQSTGPKNVWYMVKTSSGATGWINASDVSIDDKKTH